MIAGLLYLIGGLVEVLVGLRFIFRLVGVNPASPIVHWIYVWSTPFVAPFAGIFGQTPTVAVAGPGVVVPSVFDWTALIALVVYGLILGVLSIGVRR